MKHAIALLASVALIGCTSAHAAPRRHIHKMPRQPTGVIMPAPVTGVGENGIPDNFVTSDGLEAVGTHADNSGSNGEGAFRFFCTPSHVSNSDPIVYPGGISPHGHDFYGNKAVKADSTYTHLRQNGITTCGSGNAPVNRTSYWQPVLLDGVGNIVPPRYINVYYKRLPKGSTYCATNTGVPATDLVNKMGYCVGLPNGLRFIHGYNMVTMTGGPTDTGSTDRYEFLYDCRDPDNNPIVGSSGYSLVELTATGLCTAGNDMVIRMDAPHCWDGVNLDTADHRSHLARFGRVTGSPTFEGCPLTHPYFIPNLRLQAYYRIDSTFNTWQWTSDRQHSAVRGATIHFDYFEAWSPTVKAMWTDNCLDRYLSCSEGDLGNGLRIKGTETPVGGFPVPAKVPDTGVN